MFVYLIQTYIGRFENQQEMPDYTIVRDTRSVTEWFSFAEISLFGFFGYQKIEMNK